MHVLLTSLDAMDSCDISYLYSMLFLIILLFYVILRISITRSCTSRGFDHQCSGIGIWGRLRYSCVNLTLFDFIWLYFILLYLIWLNIYKWLTKCYNLIFDKWYHVFDWTMIITELIVVHLIQMHVANILFL